MADFTNFTISDLKNAFNQGTINPVSNVIKPSNDEFSLSNFSASIKQDGQRIAKGYYYKVTIFSDTDFNTAKKLCFHCQKALLPGWRTKTQQAKIYGLNYEVATELEQDPIWLTFNVDIQRVISDFFLTERKLSLFSTNTSYSPRYKNDYKFVMTIEETDENFLPIKNYVFDDCFFKTVQNINHGMDEHNIQQVTVEIIYETVRVENALTVRTDNGSGIDNINTQTKIRPFTAYSGLLNTAQQTAVNAPNWFKSKLRL